MLTRKNQGNIRDTEDAHDSAATGRVPSWCVTLFLDLKDNLVIVTAAQQSWTTQRVSKKTSQWCVARDDVAFTWCARQCYYSTMSFRDDFPPDMTELLQDLFTEKSSHSIWPKWFDNTLCETLLLWMWPLNNIQTKAVGTNRQFTQIFNGTDSASENKTTCNKSVIAVMNMYEINENKDSHILNMSELTTN